MSSLQDQLTHPLICKTCKEVISNTADSDMEIQLAINHLSKCKGKKKQK